MKQVNLAKLFIFKLIEIVILLFPTYVISQDETPPVESQAEKDMRGDKCDRLKKTYEDLTNEAAERERMNAESDRDDYLNREIPRIKEQMEYYCEKS